MAALRIIDQGDIAANMMISSWAGAMGAPQFIPTVFQAYAVDADGDGAATSGAASPRRAASTAHFRCGKAGCPVKPGALVQLPPNFDHTPGRAERAAKHCPMGG